MESSLYLDASLEKNHHSILHGQQVTKYQDKGYFTIIPNHQLTVDINYVPNISPSLGLLFDLGNHESNVNPALGCHL